MSPIKPESEQLSEVTQLRLSPKQKDEVVALSYLLNLNGNISATLRWLFARAMPQAIMDLEEINPKYVPKFKAILDNIKAERAMREAVPMGMTMDMEE